MDLKGHAFAGRNRNYSMGVAPGTLDGQFRRQATKPSSSRWFATHDAGTVPQLRRSSGFPNALDPMRAMLGRAENAAHENTTAGFYCIVGDCVQLLIVQD